MCIVIRLHDNFAKSPPWYSLNTFVQEIFDYVNYVI